MAKTTEELLIDINADITGLKSGLNRASKETSKFTKTVTKLGGVLAGVFAVSKIQEFASEAAKMAGEFEGVEAAFKRIGGVEVFDDLNKSVGGTVSELELMKAAVNARNLGLPIKELGSLFEFATKRAQDTGESVDFLVQSIVKGIGRKSPLILDNLGISAIQLKEAMGGIAVESASVAQVTAAVGKIAKKSLAETGTIIETAATRTARWGAEIDNLKVSIGRELNRAIGALSPLIDSVMSSAIKGFNEARDNVIGFANAIIELQNQSIVFRGILKTISVLGEATFKGIGIAIKSFLIEPVVAIGKILKAAFQGDFAEIPGIIKNSFKTVINDQVGFGIDTYNAFKQGFEDIQKNDPIALITDDQKEGIISNAGTTGMAAGVAFGTEALKGIQSAVDFGGQGLNELLFAKDIEAAGLGFNDSEQMTPEEIAKSILGDPETIALLNAEYAAAGNEISAVGEAFKKNQEETKTWSEALGSLSNQFTGISADLFNLALSGQKSIGALINKFIDLALAAVIAKNAIKGPLGLLAAGVAVAGLKALVSSTIGKQPETVVRGDQLATVQANTQAKNGRVF